MFIKDIFVRALKTFVQAFFGVFLPELCIFLENGFPESVDMVSVFLSSSLCAALAAGISACWNYLASVMHRPE